MLWLGKILGKFVLGKVTSAVVTGIAPSGAVVAEVREKPWFFSRTMVVGAAITILGLSKMVFGFEVDSDTVADILASEDFFLMVGGLLTMFGRQRAIKSNK